MRYITPSDVIEYLYCPCFTFYLNVLEIQQHEDKRLLVNKGRDMHHLKMVRNKEYLRKKVGAIDKEIDVYLVSKKLHLVGRVDEVLFLDDSTGAPLDYKYAFWNQKTYKTHSIQQVLYALLIEEIYDIKVRKAFVIFIRSKNKLVELEINNKKKNKAIIICREIFDIIEKNIFPKHTNYKRRCIDCTYKNLCFS